MEAIILAGGLGKRISRVVDIVPKPMADINTKPFLEYLLEYLIVNGVKNIVLSIGYKSEIIIKHFGNNYKNIDLEYSVEKKLLGTGGGIKKALKFINGNEILILNGDTYFDIDLTEFYDFHKEKKADLSVALKPITNSDRFGVVEIDTDNRIVGFIEKRPMDVGLINGGIYLLNTNLLERLKLPEIFSFEKDLLEKFYSKYEFYGKSFDKYFIDIGLPEDYERAKKELKKMSFYKK